MPNLGPAYDAAVRLKAVEERLARLEANPYGQAFSSTQSDGSVGMQIAQNTDGSASTAMIFFQASSTPRDPNTGQHPVLMYVGELYAGGASVDSGVLLNYPTGSQLAALGKDGYTWRDPDGGNIVLSNDQASGEGIARPWIPLSAPMSMYPSLWPSSPTTGDMALSYFNGQHPKVWWNATVDTDAGVTGSVQLTLSSGSQQVQSRTYSSSNGGPTYIDELLTLPQPFFDQVWSATVSVTDFSGSGHVYCQTWALVGRQS